MGTRTNFYKNPSFTYNKDFNLNSSLQNLKAYNAATGNPTSPEEKTVSGEQKGVQSNRRKRRRVSPSPDRRHEIEESDGPMSHQDYIQKLRKEAKSVQASEELTNNLLDGSACVGRLVGYDSDRSSSSENPELHTSGDENKGNMKSGNDVKERSSQRFPVPGEPVCVVCGKYGEYISDETDDGVCSMDCKAELLENLKNSKEPPIKQTSVEGPKIQLQVYDSWDFNRHRWSTKRSTLCSYECWKCKKPGHLAEDCIVTSSSVMPKDLLELYKRCHQMGKKSGGARCNVCNNMSSLGMCPDCKLAFCDRTCGGAYPGTPFPYKLLLLKAQPSC